MQPNTESTTDLLYRPAKKDPLVKARAVLAQKRAEERASENRSKPKAKAKERRPFTPHKPPKYKTLLGKAISDGMKRAKKAGRKSGPKPKADELTIKAVVDRNKDWGKPQVKLGSRTRRPSLAEVAKAINVLERAGLL